jgi:hypothetical protein
MSPAPETIPCGHPRPPWKESHHEEEPHRRCRAQRSFLGGGGAGLVLGLTHISSAATTDPSTTIAGTAPAAATGGASVTPATVTPKSNEDPTHEAGEDAAREAAENAGTAGFGRHGGASNEDATHEANEDPAREAAENAAQAANGTQPATQPPSAAAANG